MIVDNLRGINLNLLPILRELLRKRNVTHAATALNMTQPAVSVALTKMRQIFQDEILVTEGRVMIPTAFAERLMPTLEAALGEVEGIVAPKAFVPASAKGTIKIATADYVTFLCGSFLSAHVAENAPELQLEIHQLHGESDRDLRLGEIDFMILPAGGARPSLDAFQSMLLFEDEIVCLVAASSPKATFDLERLGTHRHVVASFTGAPTTFSTTLMKRAYANHFEAVRVPNFLSIPFMIEGTENVALIQRRIAERLLPVTQVRIEELPFDVPPLRVIALWSAAKEGDPAHRWFRQVLSAAGSELCSQRGPEVATETV